MCQTCSECEQGLAGTSLPEQSNKVALGIHQQVEREILLAVTSGDTPDIVSAMAVIAQGTQDGGLTVDLYHLTIERRLSIFGFGVNKLVYQHRRHYRTSDSVIGCAKPVTVFLPRLHTLAVLDPEIVGQLQDATIEQVGVFKHMVVEVLFSRQAERTRFDPHVDVFRHQYHRTPLLGLQRAHDT